MCLVLSWNPSSTEDDVVIDSATLASSDHSWCRIERSFLSDVCLCQSMENNATCRDQPTMVSKPYYRVDLFNRQMTDVLLTSLLVTTIENKTVAHIGTSTGRLLQVHLNSWNLPQVTWDVIIIKSCFHWQLVLTRSSPIIFANYSLVENQRVSSIAAVYSSEYLLFVVGDKVQQHRHAFK